MNRLLTPTLQPAYGGDILAPLLGRCHVAHQCQGSGLESGYAKLDVNEEWTDKYAFIMPTFSHAKPVCLVWILRQRSLLQKNMILGVTITQLSKSNPEQSEACRRKMSTLEAEYFHASGIINPHLTDQERPSGFSPDIKPFSHAEV